MFKNTVKLLASNFSSVWKLLLYKIIVLGIIAGLFCVTLGYINNLPQTQNLAEATVNLFGVANIANGPATILSSINALFQAIFDFAIALASTYVWVFVYLVVLFLFLLPYLWHLSDLALTEQIFGYMSSQTKFGFTSSFIRNLGQENKYSFAFTFTILPFNACFVMGVVGLLMLANAGQFWLIFSSPLLIIFVILYLALRSTLLSGWASAITTTNCKTWAGLARGAKSNCKNFAKILSNSVVFAFAFVCLCILTGVFGIIIILPVYCCVMGIFGMVVFYEQHGMRYYVDFSTIITPKKLEQTDKIKSLKYII